MGRKSKDVQWQEQTELDALAHFEQALGSLPDPRRPQGLRYPLRTVIVTALMAMVCGADDAEAMQRFGDSQHEWLSQWLEMPHGPPSQDVYLAVFAALDPVRFADVFRTWIELLDIRKAGLEDQVAIDGKTSRRSYDTGSERPAIHTVSAWLAGQGLVLGQIDTPEKSNEITAIPQLLKLLDLQRMTVTIDAMGCQTKIAREIRKGGGEYLLAVKDNQPKLHEDIAAAFADGLDAARRPLDQPAALELERFEDVSKGHGRIEEREVLVCRDLSWLETRKKWSGLAYMVMVISRRTDVLTGNVSEERRYFIGSQADASVACIAKRIREHWGIENQLHWVLDMAFHEDSARHRAGNCARNMTILRHLALNLLKTEKTQKLGIANKRKLAGWDRRYLLRVLAGAPS